MYQGNGEEGREKMSGCVLCHTERETLHAVKEFTLTDIEIQRMPDNILLCRSCLGRCVGKAVEIKACFVEALVQNYIEETRK